MRMLTTDLNGGLEKIFNDCWNEVFSVKDLSSLKNSYPKVDISENEKEVVIEAALPGLTKNDINVQCGDGYLTISGNKVERSGNKYSTKELHKSSFQRSWLINDNYDVDNIACKLEHGLLSVRIPIKAPDKPKVLKIKIG